MKALYQPGDIIQDRYRIVSILGEGGTAITYEAIDLTQEKSVAIKVLSLQQTRDWKLVELFEREIKVLKNLNHPRIPQYFDSFSIDTKSDRAFILVQELITGKSLAILVEQGWYFQEEEVKNIAQQVLEILTYLHGFQPPVIHRDIKPHNIIRTNTGEIYLVDLGAVQDIYRNTLTRGATFVGTIDYMSPEQLRGHASFASDLYSLGCTLLYLLTRRSPSELPLQRMKIDFRSSLNISERFAEWLDIILEPVLEDRFSSTKEALERLLNHKLLNLKPPKGSLISAFINYGCLQISIPSNRTINKLYLLPYFFSLFVITIVYYGNQNIDEIETVVFMTKAHLIIWTTVFGCKMLYPLLVSYQIEINTSEFILKYKYKIYQRLVKGYTLDIDKVSIDKKISSKPNTIMINAEYCSIKEGITEHNFGKHLTLAEKKWLVRTINKFLSDTHPDKFRINCQNNWLKNIFNPR